MSKIEKAFTKKAFIAFLTAGDPNIDKTEEFIDELIKAGTSLIEIGIPFSDPIAEGKTIEKADLRALDAKTTTNKIFVMIEKVRKKHPDFPLVFMTYLNPVFIYGYERFFKRCQELQMDGIIVPDLPFEEKDELKTVANKYGIDVISLIAPTSAKRIEMISKDAQGFIYLVSSLGVTGVRDNIKTNVSEIANEIKKYTNVPIAVGFGIKTPEMAKRMISNNTDGVIVGSAIVDIIEKYRENANKYIFDYAKEMVNSLQ